MIQDHISQKNKTKTKQNKTKNTKKQQHLSCDPRSHLTITTSQDHIPVIHQVSIAIQGPHITNIPSLLRSRTTFYHISQDPVPHFTNLVKKKRNLKCDSISLITITQSLLLHSTIFYKYTLSQL